MSSKPYAYYYVFAGAWIPEYQNNRSSTGALKHKMTVWNVYRTHSMSDEDLSNKDNGDHGGVLNILNKALANWQFPW